MKLQPRRGILRYHDVCKFLVLSDQHTHGAAILANMVTKTVTCAAGTYLSRTSPNLDMLGHSPELNLLLVRSPTLMPHTIFEWVLQAQLADNQSCTQIDPNIP